ncbi:hypothetical protein EV360DRAFT_80557 [Lentinula raphanica]|nr:hypothetical protein EV360DRAFT_80557 [Lentinula raphanica]
MFNVASLISHASGPPSGSLYAAEPPSPGLNFLSVPSTTSSRAAFPTLARSVPDSMDTDETNADLYPVSTPSDFRPLPLPREFTHNLTLGCTTTTTTSAEQPTATLPARISSDRTEILDHRIRAEKVNNLIACSYVEVVRMLEFGNRKTLLGHVTPSTPSSKTSENPRHSTNLAVAPFLYREIRALVEKRVEEGIYIQFRPVLKLAGIRWPQRATLTSTLFQSDLLHILINTPPTPPNVASTPNPTRSSVTTRSLSPSRALYFAAIAMGPLWADGWGEHGKHTTDNNDEQDTFVMRFILHLLNRGVE